MNNTDEQRRKAAVKAITLAGGPKRLAEALTARGFESTHYQVSKWKTRGITPKYVLPVAEIVGMTGHELHPVLYPNQAA